MHSRKIDIAKYKMSCPARLCDQARAASFDWDLHKNMRFIRGRMFIGREVEYSTPEGQVLGARVLEKTNFEEERGKRFREDGNFAGR